MKILIRYNLRDAMGLLSLVPPSTGLVHVADLASGAAIDYFQPTVDATKDGIASMVGGLSASDRIFVILALNGVVSGLLLSCLVVSLLLLRNYWATLVAFSLPFSVLFIVCLRFWMVAGPLTTETALVIGESAVVSVILAACLFSFCVCCVHRIPGSELRTKTTFSERPSWQRLLFVAAFATYLFSCAFGWCEMVSFRARAIESWNYLELGAY